MTDKQKALLAIFTYSILGGAIAAITKIGLSQIPPLSFAFIRFFLASVIIAPFIWKRRKAFVRDIKMLGPFSLLATLNIIFFILGIKLTTANSSQIIYATVPILVVLLSYFLFGEKLSFRQVLGVMLGFIGTFFVLFLPILEKGGKFSGNLFGNILLVAAVISFSIYMILSKKAQKTHSLFHIISVFIIITAVILFPFSFVETLNNWQWWNGVTLPAILSLTYMTIAATITIYWLTQYSIKHGGAVFASMAFYLSPLFGFVASAILLDESVSPLLIFAAVFTFIGIFLTSNR